MREIYYPTVQDVYDIHDEIIEVSGGLPGLNNGGLIESAIWQIQNDDYYPYLPAKITHVIYSINKGHAFLDGNKRSSLAIGALMMLKNGWASEVVDLYTRQMEDVVVWVADNIIDKADLEMIVGFFFVRYMYDFVLKGDDNGVFKRLLQELEAKEAYYTFWSADINSQYPSAIHKRNLAHQGALKEAAQKLRLIRKSRALLTMPYID